jgi:hypothetical protein
VCESLCFATDCAPTSQAFADGPLKGRPHPADATGVEEERFGLGPTFHGALTGEGRGGGIRRLTLGDGHGRPDAVAQLDDFGVTVCDRQAGRVLVVPWRAVGDLRRERVLDTPGGSEVVLDLPTAELRLRVADEEDSGWVEDLAATLRAHAPRPLPPLPDPPPVAWGARSAEAGAGTGSLPAPPQLPGPTAARAAATA